MLHGRRHPDDPELKTFVMRRPLRGQQDVEARGIEERDTLEVELHVPTILEEIL
jgi:hypothetical protein